MPHDTVIVSCSIGFVDRTQRLSLLVGNDCGSSFSARIDNRASRTGKPIRASRIHSLSSLPFDPTRGVPQLLSPKAIDLIYNQHQAQVLSALNAYLSREYCAPASRS